MRELRARETLAVALADVLDQKVLRSDEALGLFGVAAVIGVQPRRD
jgi:hypothetical protein